MKKVLAIILTAIIICSCFVFVGCDTEAERVNYNPHMWIPFTIKSSD